MQSHPYEIYVDKRPLKIAYLINPKDKSFYKKIDSIFEYNQNIWGGKFNQIILTNGKEISDKWWDLLKKFDPDVIKLLLPIQKGVLEKIDNELSPYLVEEYDNRQEDRVAHTYYEQGIPIFPTSQNVKTAGGAFFSTPKIVLFKINEDKDKTINKFIKRNFGVYSKMINMEKIIDSNNTKDFDINDETSLSEALEELGQHSYKYVYPMQVCSIQSLFPDVGYQRDGDTFTVVIGESSDDLAYFWNRSLAVPAWKRRDINQLWLPTEIANNEIIRPGLKKWLKLYSDRNNGQPTLKFVSFSLNENELEDIAKKITEGLYVLSTVEHLSDPIVPDFRINDDFRINENMDLVTANSEEISMRLQQPEVEFSSDGKLWMADVYIQFRPESFKNIYGQKYWWQLPRKNILAQALFKEPSRIKADRFPSVVMKIGEPTVKLNLLNDRTIFYHLICGENIPCYNIDARKILKKVPYFYRIERSDKGRYLSGFINVFDGLTNASHFLEKRFWRNIFNFLSKNDPKANQVKIKEIVNKLNKALKQHHRDFLKNPDDVKWLAENILTQAKHQASDTKGLKFLDFEIEAKKEVVDYNKTQQNKTKYRETDLLDDIHSLLDLGVLFAGLRPPCPSCGYTSWYTLGEVKQTIECKGCTFTFTIPPEEKWVYKLNSLIQAGYAQHGLTPVVLTLGEILRDSHRSFIYSPSLDLFKRRRVSTIGDLDIVCIKDGQFIIGEIKQSENEFDDQTIEKMAEIAKKIRPDILTFSSLDLKPGSKRIKKFKEIESDLKKLNIQVKWGPVCSFINDPSPI